MPGDISVTTTNAGGRSVTWASPTASDAVGGSLDVTCAPASGSTFAVGTTTVTCSAADAAGNSASASFSVTVTLDDDPPPPPPPGTAEWGEPISGGTLSANTSRTVPLKFRLFLDGVEVTSGSASLSVAPCGGGSAVLTIPLTFNGGRWQGHLDTGQLNPGCYTVTAMVDGQAVGLVHARPRGPGSGLDAEAEGRQAAQGQAQEIAARGRPRLTPSRTNGRGPPPAAVRLVS